MKQLLANNDCFIFLLTSSDDLEAIGMHLDVNNKLIQTKINRFELPSNINVCDINPSYSLTIHQMILK